MSRRLGLIIGLNSYQDPSFRPLLYAENDARALAQWLVNARGGKWSPSDVQHVQGQHATKELVQSLIAQLCLRNADVGDQVFLYFAGHLFLDESGEGYLALANSSLEDPQTALSLTDLTQQILVKSRASHIVCIFDCFQNGRLWSMRRKTSFDSRPGLGSATLQTLQQTTNRLFLCSCRGNEQAAESGERQLGAFAHRMIVGLTGPAGDPHTGEVQLRQLHSYLFSNLPEQQRPQLFGQDQPPMLLVGDLPTPSLFATSIIPPSTRTPTGQLSATMTQTKSQPLETLVPPPSGPLTGPQKASLAPAFNNRPLTAHLRAISPQQQQQMLAFLQKAQQLLQQQHLDEAFNLVEQVLQLAPYSTTALTIKAQILGTAGQNAEAIEAINQIIRVDAQNAMAWSMKAVLLSNNGEYAEAAQAIEQSLELDPSNPENYTIKTNIMANLATVQRPNSNRAELHAPDSFDPPSGKTFAVAFFAQQLGSLVLGTLAVALPLLVSSLPRIGSIVGLFIASICLAVMCFFALRNAFRYGGRYFLPTILTTLIIGFVLGLGYVVVWPKIVVYLQGAGREDKLPIFAFLVIWLILAAALPLLFGIIGSIASVVKKKR